MARTRTFTEEQWQTLREALGDALREAMRAIALLERNGADLDTMKGAIARERDYLRRLQEVSQLLKD